MRVDLGPHAATVSIPCDVCKARVMTPVTQPPIADKRYANNTAQIYFACQCDEMRVVYITARDIPRNGDGE